VVRTVGKPGSSSLTLPRHHDAFTRRVELAVPCLGQIGDCRFLNHIDDTAQSIAGMADDMATELTQYLASRHVQPTAAWMRSFMASMRPNTPVAALKQTSLFRLLATDITVTLSPPPAALFPADILRGPPQSRHVAGPVLCQVLDVEDIGHSRWSQVEAIESRERGEMTKGREIVRIVDQDDDSPAASTAQVQSKGPFKLLLQDAKGTQVYALELRGIDGLNTNMAMGVKLLLKNTDVRRGVVMLEPSSVQLLGGKLEALDKAWKAGRKERLVTAAKAGGDNNNNSS
jgi:RecQ-mediated genome instability protein 1